MIELQKQFQPKERNICSACGKDVGVSKLVVIGNVNICFECADLSKEMTDKERERLSKKEIERIAAIISAGDKGLIDMGMATAYMYAERLYKAGYRKVE
ncbi:hypothetical protein [Proteus mirabilis]|uniref:hypothetical protein n=1 Tax=Proteus mirabilis TaxID=584 RepID=UPI0013D0F0C8|nr:hypothetical protein [Proteus mirabilis]EKW2669694.1 hypothetical protein [Proteus mirabilis]ELA6688789.1 hypothetical protein [Proteus mirabilis]ELA6763375.1 hypothetical protein [Proteus mirabilis]MBG2779827.1 hypothetical protein [Proteus mirabilis]MBG2962087.1 hypothetical protein [Proteus mirabilis]